MRAVTSPQRMPRPRPPRLMVKKDAMPSAYCSPLTLPSIVANTTIIEYKTTVTASAISNRITYRATQQSMRPFRATWSSLRQGRIDNHPPPPHDGQPSPSIVAPADQYEYIYSLLDERTSRTQEPQELHKVSDPLAGHLSVNWDAAARL